MSQADVDDLVNHYTMLQEGWSVCEETEVYAGLVVPNGNSLCPFHRWFHLKEAYSASLFDHIMKDFGAPSGNALRVFDPFSGSATTLLSAIDYGASRSLQCSVYGVERNPFLWELGTAKIEARLGGSDLAAPLKAAYELVLDEFKRVDTSKLELPDQATLSNGKYFPKTSVQDLIALRESISLSSEGTIRSILRACLASSVEVCSRLRRDGRALRYVPGRIPRAALAVFGERVSLAIEDLHCTEPTDASVGLHLGDGRQPPSCVRGDGYDWIIFSPPYPNNIDYTEVYKTEAWVLGCYSTSREMRNQRLSTVRSHPSVRFERNYFYDSLGLASEVEAIISPVLDTVPVDRYSLDRKEMIRGYADDMLKTLHECRGLISPQGRLAFIVGNSVHGSGGNSFIIAADVLMSALAELAGWKVSEIRIARRLRRRKIESDFLRESVVVLDPS
ncbi:hypothetical protein ABT299_16715 [Spirillospora sp. NPDC000708]